MTILEAPATAQVSQVEAEISVWYQDWDGMNRILAWTTEAFKEEQPDVTLNLQPIGYGDLGLKDGLLVPITSCPGAMSDPYRADFFSEFHPQSRWGTDCANTLSNQETGRSDWETIIKFYSQLSPPTGTIADSNPGPSSLPLAVTNITFSESDVASTVLDVPIFYLLGADGSLHQASGNIQAFLFKQNRLIDLRRPNGDRVEARGAMLGDEICVYEQEAGSLVCETVSQDDEQIQLVSVSDWQPEVIISPITSQRFQSQ